MYRYADPQEIHGTDCPRCLRWVEDNELDMAPSGVCYTCSDEMEEEELSEDSIITLRPDWREIVKDIVIPRSLTKGA